MARPVGRRHLPFSVLILYLWWTAISNAKNTTKLDLGKECYDPLLHRIFDKGDVWTREQFECIELECRPGRKMRTTMGLVEKHCSLDEVLPLPSGCHIEIDIGEKYPNCCPKRICS
ncbi:hypothetical protein C0J52_24883 [Blattella germanica]|nr:hypothetical protein C0J52_24883 [Blattella germanica]